MSEEKIKNIRITEGKYLISLLRSSLRSEAPIAPPDGLDWFGLFSVAQKHIVEATVYRAVKATGACPQELLARWKVCADNALSTELLYDAERQELFEIFDREHIDYLPLKGIITKDFYPRKGMRQFSDNDILFDIKKRKRLFKIMLECGYRLDKHSSDPKVHTFYKPPVFNFEMHRALFNENSPIKYFKKVWARAIKVEGDNCAYRMTDEDYYLYNIAHFEKHFTHRGAGFRFFADLYMIRRHLPLNEEYLKKCLCETGLEQFDCEMRDIAEAWFGDEPREISEETFLFILTSGAYGTLEHAMETQYKETGRSGFLRFVFLPYADMKVRFPVLKYLPFLLPFCWVIRGVTSLFSARKRKKAALAAKYSRKNGK